MNTTTYSNHRLSMIQDGDQVLESTVHYLSAAAAIARWAKQRPSAQATLTLDGGESIHLPVYALRRRNAVVANLPDAPAVGITA